MTETRQMVTVTNSNGKVKRYECSGCGNRVSSTAMGCDHCRASLFGRVTRMEESEVSAAESAWADIEVYAEVRGVQGPRADLKDLIVAQLDEKPELIPLVVASAKRRIDKTYVQKMQQQDGRGNDRAV